MNDTPMENWEKRILAATRELPYPSTPDIAGSVRRRLLEERAPRAYSNRRLAWAIAAVLILLLATILLVPPVRAAVLDFLQIGAVRIFLVEPTATPTPTSAPSTPRQEQPAAVDLPTTTRTPTPIYLASLLDLQGETTLNQVLERLHFTPSLPTYPPDLGEPDHIYLQNQDGQVLFLVWTDLQQPDSVLLSLHAISPGSWAVTKMAPVIIDQTQVNGHDAVWAEGPYPLRLTNDSLDIRRLVDGHVLIWEQDGLTYRLESDLTMDEAIKVAESLSPIQR
jgi:hypothetical protein